MNTNMNETPASSRYTIGIFGRRNAGKSSLINAVTRQRTALTSDVPGTTTDPVSKAMEILPIGPVLLIDTAGLDDEGELGEQRVQRSLEILRKCDLVILVCDASLGADAIGTLETQFTAEVDHRGIPSLIVLNKWEDPGFEVAHTPGLIETNALTGYGIEDLKNAIIAKWKATAGAAETAKLAALERGDIDMTESPVRPLDGLVHSGDMVVLVTPIDESAPKGRMILPQQQVIRDTLDHDAMCIVTKETTLKEAFGKLGGKPDIVITDSQAFKTVAADTPEDVPLTSFSIIFSRMKGNLKKQLEGIKALRTLKPGDKVLIAEGCTHHRQCGDIGTVKIPKMLSKICDGLDLDWSSGNEFTDEIENYKLIIHCGACMLNRQEMQYRIGYASDHDVPITNYGMLMAYCNGILDRALAPFGLKL